MKRFNIILFGCMGSGKDTVADYLISEHGYVRRKLGKYIREHIELLHYNSNIVNKRDAMQKYGQSCRQILGADVWNERTLADIKQTTVGPTVIADGRQGNELEFWAKQGYIIIGIYADEDVRKRRLIERDGYAQDQYFYHETEQQAKWIVDKQCDYVINNNHSSPDELCKSIDALLETIDMRGEEIVLKRKGKIYPQRIK